MRRFWRRLARAFRSCPSIFWKNPSRTELSLRLTAELESSGHRGQRAVPSSRNTSRRNTPCWSAIRIFLKWTATASGCRISTTSFTASCRTGTRCRCGCCIGESDVDDFIKPDEYDTFKAAEADGKIKLLEPGIGAGSRLFCLQRKHQHGCQNRPAYVDPKKLKWFRNAKFRQACAFAIDREAIIKAIYSGRSSRIMVL